jgi:ABC-2 type transport system ATP-binding protein
MPAEAVRTSTLTKMYGKHRGIVDLDLVVETGEIFGYLGPNGAGKTTTIRLLMGFIRPTSGGAQVLGLDAYHDSVEVNRRTGYLSGELSLYEDLTARQLVRYLGALRGGIDEGYLTSLAARFELDLDRPIKSLSKGNKQKAGLMQAFAHRPELLILDEPTAGLDPLMQHTFLQLLGEVRAEGRTVLLSSHDLSEVQRIADRVGIIREGRLVTVDHVDALRSKSLREVEVHFAGPVPADAFAGLPGLRDLIVEDGTLRCSVAGAMDPLVKALARYEVSDLISREADLEDLFLTFYGEQVRSAA